MSPLNGDSDTVIRIDNKETNRSLPETNRSLPETNRSLPETNRSLPPFSTYPIIAKP